MGFSFEVLARVPFLGFFGNLVGAPFQLLEFTWDSIEHYSSYFFGLHLHFLCGFFEVFFWLI